MIGSHSNNSHQISNRSIISIWNHQSPNSKVRKFNFNVPIELRPEIEMIIYVKGPMCKRKPQTKINKLSKIWQKYNKNIKNSFIVGPQKGRTYFSIQQFSQYLFMRFGLLSFVVFSLHRFCFMRQKQANYNSYSCFLFLVFECHNTTANSKMNAKDSTKNHNTPTDVERTNGKQSAAVRWNIKHRTEYKAQKSNWNIYVLFVFALHL